jgi:hypothetical protein
MQDLGSKPLPARQIDEALRVQLVPVTGVQVASVTFRTLESPFQAAVPAANSEAATFGVTRLR